MKENQVSLTAIISAYIRGYHAMNETPKIFDDFLALALIPEERRTLIEQGFASGPTSGAGAGEMTTLPALLQAMGLPQVVSRARYTEEILEQAVEQGAEQYVILGAGLDTFAFRRPELLEKLHLFEVDHPATQAFKQERLAELGWEMSPQLHFVPVNFAKESLAEALRRTAYDPQKKTVVSWLGVTMYLSRDEVLATLGSIAETTPAGSSVIFDYFTPTNTELIMQAELRKIGEPFQTSFDPEELARDLSRLGFSLHEHASPAVIQQRYFQGQTDYYASEHVHFGWFTTTR
ncbi:class I SAM-dependent methyltransferase [Brevibacillus parabrevis]|uniref:class I SAM-dependent methyltransferase n=1 Tax=Brevibacillus parabrevis TaxID=54914 RepID=UPI001F604239|nr:class I SAM-dependent methyltransferase [Brevibacillus parabrevis]MDR4999843.1 class I SAM-dependent methyltransferase [Brevibacillus parabrevis]